MGGRGPGGAGCEGDHRLAQDLDHGFGIDPAHPTTLQEPGDRQVLSRLCGPDGEWEVFGRGVQEHKGAHIADGLDTAEKRTVGALRERNSTGKGRFVLAERSVESKNIRAQPLGGIGL